MYLKIEYFFIFFILSFCCKKNFGQALNLDRGNLTQDANKKSVIDSAAIVNWPHLGYFLAISKDGKYFSYSVESQSKGAMLVVGGMNSYRREFRGGTNGFFSGDSRVFLFEKNNVLYSLDLATDSLTKVATVLSYKFHIIGHSTWIAYLLKGTTKKLVIQSLSTGQEQYFDSVKNYSFDPSGMALLMEIRENENALPAKTSVKLLNLSNSKVVTIWSEIDASVGSYAFDRIGDQLAFTVRKVKDNRYKNSIWYYRSGMGKAIQKVSDDSLGIKESLYINCSDAPGFSTNGEYIFFHLQKNLDVVEPDPESVMVDIWSYKDSVLQSSQLTNQQPSFIASINIDKPKVIPIEGSDEQMVGQGGEFAIVKDKSSITNDYWWPSLSSRSLWLISLKDGTRKWLTRYPSPISFSPEGNYLVYYDKKLGGYFSYNLNSMKRLNISKGVPAKLFGFNYFGVSLPNFPRSLVGYCGWLSGDRAVWVYDNYDIWQLDPSGKNPPLNLTESYGHQHRIKFRLVDEPKPGVVLVTSKSLLLTAFNTTTKYNGFYQFFPGKDRPLQKLIMGPYMFYLTGEQVPGIVPALNTGMKPLKAAESNVWIVKRQSSHDAPNYYLTRDFKSYRALTRLNSQYNYNWLTTELVTWKSDDGKMSQGVLYKPENIDYHKKYPLIINYYEALSSRMYQFPTPEFCEGPINIPWFVSRGYLVFTPDIHYKRGQTGRSAANSVVSAARYLSRLTYIDSLKIGIQGHSFGGFETNYIVTHTHLFAAAAEAAGTSDLLSSYAELTGNGSRGSIRNSRMDNAENGQGRMGKNFWEMKKQYLENSPIISADHVVTPLLMMHNKVDPSVPWNQAIEFFLSLRRLGKKVWMLQYDNGSHLVFGRDAVDYTIRLTQFFDHYLEGAPAPVWMTRCMPARLKGVITGYELDSSGREP